MSLWEKKFVKKNKPDADEPNEDGVYDGDTSPVVNSAPSAEDVAIQHEEEPEEERV